MKRSKKVLIIVIGLLLALGFLILQIVIRNNPGPNIQQPLQPVQPFQSNNSRPKSGFDKDKYAIDQPASPWWIVNKDRPLPDGYVPADLVVPNVRLRLARNAEQMQLSRPAAEALEAMLTAAQADGHTMMLASGYRSEAYQKQLYDGYVARDGQEAADKYSARPGTSEHQTGLAADVGRTDRKCQLETCFGDTPEGQWVAANAHKHGYIIRYPKGKEAITTYQYEPWHLRYVGPELANELHENGKTMEEFFGLIDQ